MEAMTLAIALEPTPIETDSSGVVRVAKTRVTLDTVCKNIMTSKCDR